MKLRLLALPALALAATLALSSCGSDDTAADTPATTQTEAASSGNTATNTDSALTVTDPWAKAAKSGMSAVFATVTNPGKVDLTVVSAATASAASIEIHETTTGSDGASMMQEKKGGLVIPAGGSVTLAPGGDHLMLMGLTKAVVAGDAVEVTMTLSDGSTVAFTALAKDYAGAQETYAPESTGHSDEHGDEHESGDHEH